MGVTFPGIPCCCGFRTHWPTYLCIRWESDGLPRATLVTHFRLLAACGSARLCTCNLRSSCVLAHGRVVNSTHRPTRYVFDRVLCHWGTGRVMSRMQHARLLRDRPSAKTMQANFGYLKDKTTSWEWIECQGGLALCGKLAVLRRREAREVGETRVARATQRRARQRRSGDAVDRGQREQLEGRPEALESTTTRDGYSATAAQAGSR